MTDANKRFRALELEPRPDSWEIPDSAFECDGANYRVELGDYADDPPHLCRIYDAKVKSLAAKGDFGWWHPFDSEPLVREMVRLWMQSDYRNTVPLADFLNATLGDDND